MDITTARAPACPPQSAWQARATRGSTPAYPRQPRIPPTPPTCLLRVLCPLRRRYSWNKAQLEKPRNENQSQTNPYATALRGVLSSLPTAILAVAAITSMSSTRWNKCVGSVVGSSECVWGGGGVWKRGGGAARGGG